MCHASIRYVLGDTGVSMAYDMLARITGPRDLDALSLSELDRLAKEMRDAIVDRVSTKELNQRYHLEPEAIAADIVEVL